MVVLIRSVIIGELNLSGKVSFIPDCRYGGTKPRKICTEFCLKDNLTVITLLTSGISEAKYSNKTTSVRG